MFLDLFGYILSEEVYERSVFKDMFNIGISI